MKYILPFLLLPTLATAQNLSWVNPSWTVCDTQTLEIHLSPIPTQSPSLELALPPCFEYLPGSAGGLDEVDLSDPLQPDFAIQPFTSLFFLSIRVDCNCLAAIENGDLFEYNLTYADSLTFSSGLFPVQSPLLALTSATGTILSGSQGDILQRSFTLRNNRPGKLAAFTMTDNHGGGLFLNASPGTILSNAANSLLLEVGGSAFAQVGNGDAWLDQGETITITEIIEVQSCGVDTLSSLSNIYFRWGCEGDICQEVWQTAVVQFEPDPQGALLFSQAQALGPVDFCAEEGAPQALLIWNQGTEPAFDLNLSIEQTFPQTGIDPGSFNLPVQAVVPGDCGYAGKATLHWPMLAVGDTLLLTWKTYACAPACNQPANSWTYAWDYQKSCPPNQQVYIDPIPVEANQPPLQAGLSGPTQLDSSGLYVFTYALQYDSLNQLSGELRLALEIPCGFSWTGSPLALAGIPASAVEVFQAPEQTLVLADWQLPLPTDNPVMSFELWFACDSLCQPDLVCQDSVLTSCPEYQCAAVPDPNLFIAISAQIGDCGPENCLAQAFPLACQPDSICFQEVSGFLAFDYQLERINLGLNDSDDDRFPDPGLPDPALIRTDRAMEGDTIRSRLSGLVVTEDPEKTYDLLTLYWEWRSFDLDPLLNGLLLTPEGMIPLETSLWIKDEDTGLEYACNNIPLSADTTGGQLRFGLFLSAANLGQAGCAIPIDWQWGPGDSLEVISLFRVGYNPIPQDPGGTLAPVISLQVTPQAFLDSTFSCGCQQKTLEISGRWTTFLPGVFALPACDTSEYQGASLFSIDLGEANFFPYEYRPLGWLDPFSATFPAWASLTQARLRWIRPQGGPFLFQDQPLAGIAQDSAWTFSLAGFQDTLLDEGFSVLVQYRLLRPCDLEGAFPLTVEAVFNSPDGPENWLAIDPGSLKILSPEIQLQSPLPDIVSPNEQALWLLEFQHQSNTILGQNSGPAPGVQLQVFSPSGLVGDFVLISQATGDTIPAAGGVFQLGDLGNDSLFSYWLHARNNSCSPETVVLSYNWNCGGETCWQDEIYLSVLSPEGLPDMSVSPLIPACSQLCDTLPFHLLTLVNSGQGPLCDPVVEILTPAGFFLLSGSAEASWPSGAPFEAIADPIPAGNGYLQWSFPGICLTAGESLDLRFSSTTSCDFIANSTLQARGSGKLLCGEPTAISTALGPPVCLTVGDPEDLTWFNSGLEAPVGCSDEAVLNIALVHANNTLPSDSLYIWLPPGIAYVPGSMNPIQNAPPSEPIQDGSGLKWALPAGLQPFDLIAFQITVTGFAGVDCGEYFVSLQATAQTNAVCVQSGEDCSLSVETGSAWIPIEVERTEWAITGFFAGVFEMGNLDSVAYQIEIQPPGAFWQLLLGDSVLYTGTEASGSVWLDEMTSVCELQALVSQAQNCTCGADTAAVALPITYHLPQPEAVCPGIPVEAGICLPGFSYQWTAGCDTCCINTFNNPTAGVFETTLTASSPGCNWQSNFSWDVLPEPGIAYADTAICPGQTALLLAEPGLGYTWTGPGIIDPDQPAQLVSPVQTSEYHLTMTDSLGCVGDTSLVLVVYPLPLAEAGPDTFFCPGQIPGLQALDLPGQQYFWMPSGAVNQPNSASTVITDFINQELVLEVTSQEGCLNRDTIAVSFGQPPALSLPPDTLVCAGEGIQLQASGADTYDWSPEALITCVDANCATVWVYPSFSTLITLSGTGSEGCQASGAFVLQTVEDGSETLDSQYTCLGTPVELFGEWTDQPGWYCDTLLLPSGCRQIQCTELLVSDTSATQLDIRLCQNEMITIAGMLFDQSGDYSLTLPNQWGCDSTLYIHIESYEYPAYGVWPADTTIQSGDTLILTLSGQAAEILWSATPAAYLACPGCQITAAVFYEDSEIALTFTDSNGCRQAYSIAVEALSSCSTELPNIITPNGDGHNDFFGILTRANLETIQFMEIYNRWGQPVFSSLDPAAVWDGAQNGLPVPADVYVYRLAVRCPGGYTRIYQGELTVIR